MDEKELKKTITEIAEKTGKSEEEISELIKAKIEKFSGLLTEQGAAFMVQKELGLKQETAEQIKISELEEGMKGIEIKGTIEAIYPVKEFEKNSKKGKLQSLIINDGTGEIRLTLWNDQVGKYDLTRKSEITISNAIITTYNEKKQAILGFNGTITINKKKEEEFEKIADLKSGTSEVNVIGRIMRKFPCKEFESGERKGKLCSFQLGDETAVVRVTAWNEKAEEMEKFNEGDAIEIINAYTKDGKFGIELHAGYSASIKETQKEVAKTQEILKETMKENKISQLVEGENAVINGKINSIEKGNYAYEVCANCGKKIIKTENGIFCEKCGETKAKKNAVISVIIEDESGIIRTNFFGKTALNAMELTQEELEKQLTEKTPDIIEAELNGKLVGKEIKVYGYTRTNNFSGNKEFNAREIL